MDVLIMWLWVIGFIVSIVFFIKSILDYKSEKAKKPIIIFGITSFVLSVPIILVLILIIGLSTGLVRM